MPRRPPPHAGDDGFARMPDTEAPPEAAPSDTLPDASEAVPTLLIVEDDRNFARILEDMARDRGYAVRIASRGSEALELAGGRGMLRSSPLERFYRDVRAYSVSPPTINASMVNIGSRLLAPGAMRETLVEEGV